MSTDNARAEALEAAAAQFDHLYRDGLMPKRAVLADLAEWADRSRRGIRPNGREWAAGRAETTTAHEHDWKRQRNVTSKGYELPTIEVCQMAGCDAARRAETATEGTQPGCTGAGDCPAPAHLHGCFADTEG